MRSSTMLVALVAALVACDAHSHSASDAYLTLTSESGGTVIRGQWDIALRDLDFVLRLDDDGDGRIAWREFKARRSAIEKYAYSKIAFQADGKPCRIKPGKLLITDHADGAYAALFFDGTCRAAPQRLSLDYRLFFAIDPSHRAIVVWRSGADVATSVLSPEVSRIGVDPRQR